ncbi:MAG: Spo0B domain-containing protein, partial [Lachnospiraceae bacterium]|nr:Spo0B domain-containing protein [Lachnospiraceae bacterium]
MSRTEIFLIILAIYAALSTAAFLLIGHFRKKSKEKQFFEFQDKILHTQMEEMNQIYENMRGWRHDYHNHMQTIKAHLALGQVTEAEDYVDRMEGELDRIDFKYKTGNIGVDAILNSKLTLAEKHGIAVKCDAVLPGEIPVSQLDLCVILGNLIDNAVEACDKMAGGDGHADKDEHRNEDREKSGDEYRNENRDKSRDEHRNENRDKSR